MVYALATFHMVWCKKFPLYLEHWLLEWFKEEEEKDSGKTNVCKRCSEEVTNLLLSMLCANLVDNNDIIFQKTFAWNGKSFYLGKIRKITSEWFLLEILPGMLNFDEWA